MNLKYKLHILSGPKKNSFFNIQNKETTLGRGSNNDINLDFDATCSRQHAVIKSFGAVTIYNISKDNKITVNDQLVKSSHALVNADYFCIGKTFFKIEISKSLQKQPIPVQNFSTNSPAGPAAEQKSFLSKKNIIIAAVVVLLLLIMLPSKKKKKVKAFTSFQNIEKEIKSIKKQTSELYKEQKTKRLRDQIYKKAQIFYLSGFREYKQGKYKNAADLFQACLSLVPEHKLCNRYIILSRRKFLELVQYHMLLGQKYLKQHQNKSCKTAFNNVMIMLANKNNSIYKEAKVNLDLCTLRLKGQY